MNFKKINTLTGWIVFAIATLTYLFSMERTSSFWDCGEFIVTAYKLEVAHSPGAPLYMMIGRMFGMLAPSPEMAGFYINGLSALASGFTILFLFWTITHFARKIVVKEDTDAISKGQLMSVIGAGIVGALAYTFSDTFWFSAVEAEVYATSSFFTALTFWAILKWEHVAKTDVRADRWLVLIFFLIGLSIGVHLLNLLTIPSIILVYYLRRYEKPTLKGGILAFLTGGLVLAIVQFGIIKYLAILASKFEIFFTNALGMPFNSGTLIFLVLIAVALFFVIRYAKKKSKYLLYLSTFCFAFTLLGFVAPYASTVIRSKADVPIDMVNPDNVVSLIPYLQREQYGSQPIFSGNNYDAELVEINEGDPVYAARKVEGKDRYVEVSKKQEPVYSPSSLFPRLWDRNKAKMYQQSLGLEEGDSPSMSDNLSFFFNYQLNQMYWRYFMWNYSGRQNDYQGQGEAKHGNWITGVGFVDQALGRGDLNKASDSFKENRARNEYYALPFILGIIGLLYHYKKDKGGVAVVFSLFIMTGLAIVVFLNNSPMQPRERDYAYVSTFPFAIWIGIGVMQLSEWLNKIAKGVAAPAIATVAALLAVPVLMLAENWDDHNRAPKRLAIDHAHNMLNSCDSNAILIVNGDNDTYPLWYAQEVEGYRTDVRVLNYNLLNTDWQLEQMFKKVNKADAVPMIWEKEAVQGSRLEIAYIVEDPRVSKSQSFAAEDLIKFVSNEKNDRQLQAGSDPMAVVPTRNVHVTVDSLKLAQSGILNGLDSFSTVAQLSPDYKPKRMLFRADLAILNMVAGVAKEGWKRPIYFASGTPAGGFEPYLLQEGLLNKLVPVKSHTPLGAPKFTGAARNIDLLTKQYTLGNAGTAEPYYDEKAKNTLQQYRVNAYQLAMYLFAHNKKEEGVKVLDKITASVSESSYPTLITLYDRSALGLIEAYYRLGAKDKAVKMGDRLANNIKKDTDYYLSLSDNKREGYMQQLQYVSLNSLSDMARIAGSQQDSAQAVKWAKLFQELAQKSEMTAVFKQLQQQQQQQQSPELKLK